MPFACRAAELPPRPSPRARLTIEDRVRIQDGLAAGMTIRAIASAIGASHTTVSREVGARLDSRGRSAVPRVSQGPDFPVPRQEKRPETSALTSEFWSRG